MRNILVVLLVFLPGFLLAQKIRLDAVDSINASPAMQKEDTIKVILLNKIFEIFSSSNGDSALLYGNRGLLLSKKLNWNKGIAYSENNIGSAYIVLEDSTKASNFLMNAATIYRQTNDENGLANVYNALCYLYTKRGDTQKVISYINDAIRIYTKTANTQGLLSAYTNLGYYYHVTLKFPDALKYLSKALDIAESLNDYDYIINSYDQIGHIYLHHLNDKENGRKYFNKSLEICQKINYTDGIIEAYNNMGSSYQLSDNTPKRLEYLLMAMKLAEEAGKPRLLSTMYQNAAAFYSSQTDYDKQREYTLKALAIDEHSGDSYTLINEYNGIGITFFWEGKYDSALVYYNKALKIDTETHNRTYSNRLINIGLVYVRKKMYVKAMDYCLKGMEIASTTNGTKKIGFETAAILFIGENYINIYKDSVPLLPTEANEIRELIKKYHSDIEFPENKQLLLQAGIKYLKFGLDLSIDGNWTVGIMEAYRQLIEANKLNGDFENSLQYAQKLIALNDSVYKKSSNDKIATFFLQNEYDKKNLAQEKETALRLQKKNSLIWVSFGGLIVVLVIIIIVLRNFAHQKKANRIIMAEKENAEAQRLRAEQSERFKQQFLANMSHEIRTPMNAVLGMTNLIIDNPQSPKLNKYLTAIKKSSENLLVIINDILDLSKLQAGKMDLEKIPFSISDQLQQVYNTMQFKAEEKGLILETIIARDIPDVLVGDPSRLNQILINLCANAIKFTEKGKVSIVVEPTNSLIPALSKVEGAPTQVAIHFKVIDQGIGIPADKVGRLFESFQQVDASTSRKYGGTGLGLSISKTLVELQGGKMEVKSEDGKGSEFSFTISYAIATEEEFGMLVKEVKIDHSSLTGMKILVGEDNEYNQVVIKDTLENLIKGVKVDVAENGKLVIDKLTSGNYDVILMDVQMPEMNGLEASQYIRKHVGDIPIIALTASVLNTDLGKCFDAGMNDYIPKPFTRAQLLNTLAKYYKSEAPASDMEIATRSPA